MGFRFIQKTLHAPHNTLWWWFQFVDPDSLEARSFILTSASMSSAPAKNPSARVLHMDAESLELTDYDHYSLYLGNVDDGGLSVRVCA